MTDAEILHVYMLQSENVRALWQAKNGLVKDINFQIRKSDVYQLEIKTKFLSLAYSAWSEAQFIQILFTPNGFMYSEILKIKSHKERYGISDGWRMMLEEAMKRVGDADQNKDLKSRLKTLVGLVDSYIEEPSILRNKIAHGQWIRALNRDNTNENQELTDKIKNLDPVDIEKRFDIHRFLGAIVRDLVQSPKAGFHRHYWTNVVNLEKYLKMTDKWSLETKKAKLQSKPITHRHQ
jgi:hypothetical protein